MTTFHNFIGGAWVAPSTGDYFENRNPADQQDLIGRFPASGVADVEAAVASAQRGFDRWKRTPAPARGDVLRRVGDLMAARNHGSAGREMAAGMYIKTMFGMEPPPFTDFGTLAFYR